MEAQTPAQRLVAGWAGDTWNFLVVAGAVADKSGTFDLSRVSQIGSMGHREVEYQAFILQMHQAVIEERGRYRFTDIGLEMSRFVKRSKREALDGRRGRQRWFGRIVSRIRKVSLTVFGQGLALELK